MAYWHFQKLNDNILKDVKIDTLKSKLLILIWFLSPHKSEYTKEMKVKWLGDLWCQGEPFREYLSGYIQSWFDKEVGDIQNANINHSSFKK